jgi:hypothetical protein
MGGFRPAVIPPDATERRPSREWGPTPYLKHRLTEAKRYRRSSYACTDSGRPGLACDWPAYLAGFVTAEGHFGVVKTSTGSLAPRLTLRLRADDLPLLEEIRDRLQAGKIYGPYNEAGRSPVLNWIVLSRQDLGWAVTAYARVFSPSNSPHKVT